MTTTESQCAPWRIIRYSVSEDSGKTVTQVRVHNATYRRLCGRRR